MSEVIENPAPEDLVEAVPEEQLRAEFGAEPEEPDCAHKQDEYDTKYDKPFGWGLHDTPAVKKKRLPKRNRELSLEKWLDDSERKVELRRYEELTQQDIADKLRVVAMLPWRMTINDRALAALQMKAIELLAKWKKMFGREEGGSSDDIVGRMKEAAKNYERICKNTATA